MVLRQSYSLDSFPGVELRQFDFFGVKDRAILELGAVLEKNIHTLVAHSGFRLLGEVFDPLRGQFHADLQGGNTTGPLTVCAPDPLSKRTSTPPPLRPNAGCTMPWR